MPHFKTESEDELFLRLVSLLNHNLFFLKQLSLLVDQAEFDGLANAMLSITLPARSTLPLIHSVVEAEFLANERNPGSIMRGNCVASKLMGVYSRHTALPFLKHCVGELIEEQCSNQTLFEINPTQLTGENVEERLAENQLGLEELTERFILRVLNPETLQVMPRGIRAIAGFTAEYAKKYAPDRLCPLVGGFLMLRLFNPSLISPESVGLLPQGAKMSKEARRNFTFVSKILQNLSNGLLFGAKEQYMVCMNGLIERYSQPFREFLIQVAVDDFAEPGQPDWAESKRLQPNPIEIQDLQTKQVLALHTMLVQFRGRFLEILNDQIISSPPSSPSAYDEEEEVFRVLDELPEPAANKKGIQDPENTSSSFLTRQVKAGLLRISKGKIRKKETRQWVVLSPHFAHFLLSPEDKKPSKSIPLTEFTVALPETNSNSGAPESEEGQKLSFRMRFDHKDVLLHCDSPVQVSDWISTISELQVPPKRSVQSSRQVTALESRIRNHLRGIKAKYTAKGMGWEPHGDSIFFVFQVEGMETLYYVKKSLTEFLDLHNELTQMFPHIIFPTIPPEILKNDSKNALVGIRKKVTAIRRSEPNASPPPIRPNHRCSVLLEQQSFAGLDPLLHEEPEEVEKKSKMVYMIGDNPSEGAINAVHFVSAYLADLMLNVKVAESRPLLQFLDILSIRRMVEECSKAQVEMMLKSQFDINSLVKGRTALHVAVGCDRVSAVRLLCSMGVSVDLPDAGNNTPLHYACRRGLSRAARELVSLGANVNALNTNLQSPLFLACEAGNRDLVRYLTRCGASSLLVDSKGNTPLSLTITGGHQNVIKVLVGSRTPEQWAVDSAFRLNDGSNLLHLATSLGMSSTVNLLLHHLTVGVNSASKHGVRPLHQAAKRGYHNIVKLLLQQSNLDCRVVDSLGHSPLFLAAQEGHENIVRALLPLSDLHTKSQQGETPLMAAAAAGRSQIVNLILQYDSNTLEGGLPLLVAVKNNRSQVVEILLKYGEQSKRNLQLTELNVLYWAIIGGDDSIVRQLLAVPNIDPYCSTEDDMSLLHVAAYGGHAKVVSLLCDARLNLNRQDPQGNSPLHVACSLASSDVVQVLVDKGADVILQNSDGDTPLHLACQSLSIESVRVITNASKKGVNTINKAGCTPLHLAVTVSFAEGAVHLTKLGAKVSSKNKNRQTPLSLAPPILKRALMEVSETDS